MIQLTWQKEQFEGHYTSKKENKKWCKSHSIGTDEFKNLLKDEGNVRGEK